MVTSHWWRYLWRPRGKVAHALDSIQGRWQILECRGGPHRRVRRPSGGVRRPCNASLGSKSKDWGIGNWGDWEIEGQIGSWCQSDSPHGISQKEIRLQKTDSQYTFPIEIRRSRIPCFVIRSSGRPRNINELFWPKAFKSALCPSEPNLLSMGTTSYHFLFQKGEYSAPHKSSFVRDVFVLSKSAITLAPTLSILFAKEAGWNSAGNQVERGDQVQWSFKTPSDLLCRKASTISFRPSWEIRFPAKHEHYETKARHASSRRTMTAKIKLCQCLI